MSSKRIEITDEIREKICNGFERAEVSLSKLSRGRRDAPSGFEPTMIERIAQGEGTTVRRDHFDYALKLLADAPSLVPLDADTREHISSRLDALGLSPEQFMRKAAPSPPRFTARDLGAWLETPDIQVRQDHLDWVLEALERAEPARKARIADYVAIPPETLAAMKARMRELDRGAISLLKDRDDVPDGMNPGTVERWFNRPDPRTSRIYLDYFLARLAEARAKGELPAASPKPRSTRTLASRLRWSDENG